MAFNNLFFDFENDKSICSEQYTLIRVSGTPAKILQIENQKL